MADGKDHVYVDRPLDSIYIYICQFKRNPDLETAIRARFNPKHIDERARIVQKTANKISQAVRCCWHVRRWVWVGPDSGKGFGGVGSGKVSTMAFVILLDALYEMIRLDRNVKKGPTHRSKRVCLGWDMFNNSIIPIHLHIWNLRNLRILSCVSRLERGHIAR